MIASVQTVRVVPRFNPATVALCAVAIAFIACRMAEAPANPATAFRIAMSVLAIGFVAFARHTSLLQRAKMFVALEALGGFVAFVYIDLPFVVTHQAQIGGLAATLYHIIHQAH